MSVRLFLISFAAVGFATAALAQEAPVARTHTDDTAALTAPSPPAVKPPVEAPRAVTSAAAAPPAATTDRQIAEWLKADDNPVQPLDPHAETADGPGRRQIHGEVGAYVSSRGYGGYAATSLPLGEASELDVAVSGEHLHTRWGRANPRSVAVALRLDGGDVNRWLSRDKCNVPRWGVSLPGDPQVLADGSCREAGAGAPARPAP